MQILKITSLFIVLFSFFLLSNCKDKTKIIVEKEKVIYKDSLKQAIEKTENRLYVLRKKLEAVETDSAEKVLRDWIYDFKRLDDELNRKIGEIDYVEVDDWEKKKNEIDTLISELNEKIKRLEKK